ncbi:unnamed protein product [Cylicostephanus goldi]|uniref:Uncharacterized protein n=1 Tax=Cylicostephanus goldi TaxID=71465 RepID=A0A3P6T4P5_CYLGO|nr:unnamed protein product [Cylicostephanus goldi]
MAFLICDGMISSLHKHKHGQKEWPSRLTSLIRS